MALSTYTELTATIANWLDVDSDDMTTIVDDLVNVAEIKIFNEINCRYQHASFSLTIASGVVAIPTDFLDHVSPYVVTTINTALNYPLSPRSAEFIYKEFPYRAASSLPRHIATEATNFIFGPYPDAGVTYVLKGLYKKKLTPVSTSINALFAAHPEIYLYAALVESERLIGRDKRIQYWEARYQSSKKLLNGEDVKTTGQARAHY